MARVRANEVVDDKVLLKRAYAEIEKLKAMVAQLRRRADGGGAEDDGTATGAQDPSGGKGGAKPHILVAALQRENTDLRAENERLRQRFAAGKSGGGWAGGGFGDGGAFDGAGAGLGAGAEGASGGKAKKKRPRKLRSRSASRSAGRRRAAAAEPAADAATVAYVLGRVVFWGRGGCFLRPTNRG